MATNETLNFLIRVLYGKICKSELDQLLKLRINLLARVRITDSDRYDNDIKI